MTSNKQKCFIENFIFQHLARSAMEKFLKENGVQADTTAVCTRINNEHINCIQNLWIEKEN